MYYLLKKYNEDEYLIYEVDCSVITKENAYKYLPAYNIEQYVEEFYSEKNCTLYFIGNEARGFIINWDKKIVKLFLDRRYPKFT